MNAGHLRLLVAAALFALSGCEQLFQNGATRAIEQAEKKEKEGDHEAAVRLYESALDGTPKCAEVHYRLALIYDDKIKDAVSATHHFQRYLALLPRGPHAKDARRFAEADELKIITSFSKGAFVTQEDAVRLKNDNLALRKQLMELHAQRAAPALNAAGNSSRKPIPAGAGTYTVEPGDTLASISRRFFKTSGRWKDIQDANFNSLSGTVKLKPGMTLMIPAK